MRVRFALVSEGSSERPLIPHLEELCVRAGADEAQGIDPRLDLLPDPPGRAVGPKLDTALTLAAPLDLVFVHRDADRVGVDARRQEIAVAAARHPHLIVVPIIPVTKLEAWLLVDESAIRRAVGNPRGRSKLNLPAARLVEGVADPKARLNDALLAAAGASGRRLARLKREFYRNRAWLLEELDLDGPITALPSWCTLLDDIDRALTRLASYE